MKIMVKLAVLFATLLLLNGVALAGGCDCYEVTYTNLDDPTQVPPEPSFVQICYGGYPVGTIRGLCTSCYLSAPLYMFFEETFLSDQMLTVYESCAARLKFHGNNNNVLTGISFGGEFRYTIWGHKTDGINCNCNKGS